MTLPFLFEKWRYSVATLEAVEDLLEMFCFMLDMQNYNRVVKNNFTHHSFEFTDLQPGASTHEQALS